MEGSSKSPRQSMLEDLEAQMQEMTDRQDKIFARADETANEIRNKTTQSAGETRARTQALIDAEKEAGRVVYKL